MDAVTEWAVKEYSKLVGRVCIGVTISADEKFIGLVFAPIKGKLKKSIAWVQKDEEGNGPGFLAIT